MKAAVYYPNRGIQIDDRSLPEPQVGELRIKVAAVGICGSDMHYYKDGHIGEWWIRQPHILGHEFSGIVDAMGRNVDGFSTGDRVAIEPILPCETCFACQAGRYNLCFNLCFTGSPYTDGAFQEYVIARPCLTHLIPDSMSLKQAALVEPASIAVHAVRRSGMQLGNSVAIIGAVPIGLLTLAVARVSGASKSYISDLDEFRLQKAKQMGATKTINSKDDPVQELDDLTKGRGVDLVFEAVGHHSTLEAGLKMRSVRAGSWWLLE